MIIEDAREGMGGEMGIDAMADEALQEAYNHGCAHMAACTGAGTREAEMEHEAHAADARAALLTELARVQEVEGERDEATEHAENAWIVSRRCAEASAVWKQERDAAREECARLRALLGECLNILRVEEGIVGVATRAAELERKIDAALADDDKGEG